MVMVERLALSTPAYAGSLTPTGNRPTEDSLELGAQTATAVPIA